MNKTVIVALFGAAGAGKDAIQKTMASLAPESVHEIISSTTRPPRDYEAYGVDYIFLTDQQAQENLDKNNYLEHANFRGWTYGTLKDSIVEDKINIGVFNISGVKQLLEHQDQYEIIPIYIQCSDKERLLRQLNREDKPDCTEICRRFQADAIDLAPTNLNFHYWNAINENVPLEVISKVLLSSLTTHLYLGRMR